MALVAGTSMSSYLGHRLLLRKFYRRFCRCALSTDTVRIETITTISRVRDLSIHRVLGCLTKTQQKTLLLRLHQLLDNKYRQQINNHHSNSSRSQIQMTRSKVFQMVIKLLESRHPYHKGHLGVCGVSSQSCKVFRTLWNDAHSFGCNSIALNFYTMLYIMALVNTVYLFQTCFSYIDWKENVCSHFCFLII